MNTLNSGIILNAMERTFDIVAFKPDFSLSDERTAYH